MESYYCIKHRKVWKKSGLIVVGCDENKGGAKEQSQGRC